MQFLPLPQEKIEIVHKMIHTHLNLSILTFMSTSVEVCQKSDEEGHKDKTGDYKPDFISDIMSSSLINLKMYMCMVMTTLPNGLVSEN